MKRHYKKDGKLLCGRKRGVVTAERDYVTCRNCIVKIVNLEDQAGVVHLSHVIYAA